jgi:uncharacterized protein (DUF433 family)
MKISIVTEPTPLSTDEEGVLRVGGTRVSLDSVVFAFKQGATPEEIAQQYTSLNLADVYAVISYFLHHSDEIEAYLQARHEQRKTIRRETEIRFDPNGVRARLLARRGGGTA